MPSFWKSRPAFFSRRDQAREKLRTLQAVHAAVRQRDSRQCRCCGKPATHQHHIVYRSKGGENSSENLITLDAGCHALIHARQLWIIGTNADKWLLFDVDEAAVVDVFGVKPVPSHVRIVTRSRTA